ncbi:MAG TPA: hypothetical protein VGF39_18495 [Stellaceae bacterium]|jgi:hypothetical protein
MYIRDTLRERGFRISHQTVANILARAAGRKPKKGRRRLVERLPSPVAVVEDKEGTSRDHRQPGNDGGAIRAAIEPLLRQFVELRRGLGLTELHVPQRHTRRRPLGS